MAMKSAGFHDAKRAKDQWSYFMVCHNEIKGSGLDIGRLINVMLRSGPGTETGRDGW